MMARGRCHARHHLHRECASLRDGKRPAPTVAVLAGNGQDGLTRSRPTSVYGRLTFTGIMDGIEGRLVEAEATLAAVDVAQFVEVHYALRAAPPLVGEVQAIA
jgi:starch-binding outer membrane protein, SusD/RagB family